MLLPLGGVRSMASVTAGIGIQGQGGQGQTTNNNNNNNNGDNCSSSIPAITVSAFRMPNKRILASSFCILGAILEAKKDLKEAGKSKSKILRVYCSILVVSCFVWSGTLDRSALLLSCPVISLS